MKQLMNMVIDNVRVNNRRFSPRVMVDTMSYVRARALADALLRGELNSLHNYAALVRFMRMNGGII